MAQRWRSRTFFCSRARSDSIAALSPQAPTRPLDHCSAAVFRALTYFLDRNWLPLGPCTITIMGVRGRAWARRLLVGLSVTVLVGVAGSLVVGELLIRPAAHPVGPPPLGLAARTVTIPVAGHRRVHGWLVPGRPELGSVLLLHGVRSDRRSMVSRARFLGARGYTVLLIDLQAHGETPGRHITYGRLESEDVRAAAGYLRSHRPGRPVAVVGVSLGAAAAVLAEPALDVQAVVLESMYATFDSAVDNRMRHFLGPAGPLLSGLLVVQLPLRLGISSDELRPIDLIGRLRAPVLICAGDQDPSVPPAETRALYDAAARPKQLWMVPGAAHVDLYAFGPAEYLARVGRFLDRYLGPAG